MLSVLQESFWERLSGVIGLKRPVYEAIQRDPEATSQSWWIVVLLGLANGIAWIVTPIVAGFPGMTDEMARDVAALAAAFTFDTTQRQIMALAVAIAVLVLSSLSRRPWRKASSSAVPISPCLSRVWTTKARSKPR